MGVRTDAVAWLEMDSGIQTGDRAHARVGGAGVPWYLWVGVAAVTSSTVGGQWDLAWHRSIGRDSFWTPAHVAVYACGVMAAIVCLWLAFVCTTGRSNVGSIKVLGLRAPLGVFIVGWGGVAMLTSAPFDNWWHNAYGVDVKVISPPHMVLLVGMRAVTVGTLVLILAAMNRARNGGELEQVRRLRWMYLYMGGLAVGDQMFFLEGYTLDTSLHRMTAYAAMAVALPVFFALLQRTSGVKWAATISAAIYTAFLMGEILIFPLFPAQPRLGPVWFPVTHLMPAKFPILIIAPAVALDVLWQRANAWKPWKIAALAGVLFVCVLVAVEWPFASFLMTKASENRFFGTMYFGFYSRPDGFNRMRMFIPPPHGVVIAVEMMVAAICAAVSYWVGERVGMWMREVRR